MISPENKAFLYNRLNIDPDKYTKEELNLILDNIIILLKQKIEIKKENIKNLEIEIMKQEDY